MIDNISNAVIITMPMNTPLSRNGSLKKKDKTNLANPVSIKLKVKNILKPSSTLELAR